MTDDAEQERGQQAIMAFLGSAAAHDGAEVKRIDTHAASVFLAGERVLKVKRAVKFPFLDYSTLAKRKAACEAELAVNRPYAPELYRGVVPITRAADGALAVDGKGEPVEWAVEMSRFDETQTLDHLAEADRIDTALADALGRAVARAHDKAEVVHDFHFADVLAGIIAQNDKELREGPDLFAPDDVRALGRETNAALASVRALLAAREADGLVRRCHGDLHLGNIVLIDGAPVLFDAIEFDAKIATSDVFYDLAFLLMDLIERDLTGAANIVLNRYLAEANRDSDLDVLKALPLFMSVRAAIRAKVMAARRKDDADDAAIAESARAYFALALKLIAPPKPTLVAVGGLSGTGKSVLARALAPLIAPPPGAVWLRSDVARKRLFGAEETERLPKEAYAPEITASVYATLTAKGQRIVAAGHSTLVDAVFAGPDERATIAEAAGDAAFEGLFLTADLATRVARVGGRTGDASDADAKVAQAQESYDLGAIDWHTVDASGTPEDTLERTRDVLALPEL